MMRAARRVLLVAIFAGCGSACANSDNSSPELTSEVQESPVQNIPVSAFEESLIADGTASAVDLDAALEGVVACLDSKGYPSATYELHLPWDYSMDVPGEGADAAHTACEAEYLDAVSALYFDQNGPTDDENAAANALALECLREAGNSIPEDMEFSDAMFLVDDFEFATQCLVQAQDEVRPPE